MSDVRQERKYKQPFTKAFHVSGFATHILFSGLQSPDKTICTIKNVKALLEIIFEGLQTIPQVILFKWHADVFTQFPHHIIIGCSCENTINPVSQPLLTGKASSIRSVQLNTSRLAK